MDRARGIAATSKLTDLSRNSAFLHGVPQSRETTVKQRVAANSISGGLKRLRDFFASHQSQRGAGT